MQKIYTFNNKIIPSICLKNKIKIRKPRPIMPFKIFDFFHIPLCALTAISLQGPNLVFGLPSEAPSHSWHHHAHLHHQTTLQPPACSGQPLSQKSRWLSKTESRWLLVAGMGCFSCMDSFLNHLPSCHLKGMDFMHAII